MNSAVRLIVDCCRHRQNTY